MRQRVHPYFTRSSHPSGSSQPSRSGDSGAAQFGRLPGLGDDTLGKSDLVLGAPAPGGVQALVQGLDRGLGLPEPGEGRPADALDKGYLRWDPTEIAGEDEATVTDGECLHVVPLQEQA